MTGLYDKNVFIVKYCCFTYLNCKHLTYRFDIQIEIWIDIMQGRYRKKYAAQIFARHIF